MWHPLKAWHPEEGFFPLAHRLSGRESSPGSAVFQLMYQTVPLQELLLGLIVKTALECKVKAKQSLKLPDAESGEQKVYRSQRGANNGLLV